MSRIERTFASLTRPALVTFITAGDPDMGTSLKLLHSLPGAGADIIELGMPFTDPMADGPVIQAASLRALKSGANMLQTLDMVQEFRTQNDKTPIILMGYFNPVLAYGPEKFVHDAAAAGVDGLIIVDLPPEEGAELYPQAKQAGLDIIRLITPTTDAARLPKVLSGASGFLYYVSITGVTGTAQADSGAVRRHIEEIRSKTNLPIAIGFGIKTPDDARKMAEIGDAVVVGSAIVQALADDINRPHVIENIGKQVRSLAAALHN